MFLQEYSHSEDFVDIHFGRLTAADNGRQCLLILKIGSSAVAARPELGKLFILNYASTDLMMGTQDGNFHGIHDENGRCQMPMAGIF
jgi:hypothetical protein